MKKFIITCMTLILFAGIAMAEESSGYGLSFGYGTSLDDIDIYRIGLKKDFSTKWFEKDLGYFSGYYELSYNRWEYGEEAVNGVAISPVFAYYFNGMNEKIVPYLEFGIGGAYIDNYNIKNRKMASNFQFEDRIGMGARIGFIDLNFRYMHYSNASLEKPNHGIDIWIFSTSIQF